MKQNMDKVIQNIRNKQNQKNLKDENKKLKSELKELRDMLEEFRNENKSLKMEAKKQKSTDTKTTDTEMHEIEQQDAVQASTQINSSQVALQHDASQAVTHPDGFKIVTNKRNKRLRPSDDEDEKNQGNKQDNIKKGKTDLNNKKIVKTAEKREEVPPVTVKVQDWNAFSTSLIKNKINYNKARNTPEGIKISPNAAEDYRNLIKMCEDKKMEYFTYTLQEDKKKYYVIKGLHISANCLDVEKELKEIGAEDAEVTRLISRRNKLPTAVLQLKTNYAKIMEITRLRYMVVKIEAKRKDKGPIQCYRCQRYGHTRRNCGFEARCVRCGQNHETNLCKMERTAGRNATCANCRGNHPANYKGCTYAEKNKKPHERGQPERNNMKEDKKTPSDKTPKKSQEENKLKDLENRMDKMMSILQKLMEAQQRNG